MATAEAGSGSPRPFEDEVLIPEGENAERAGLGHGGVILALDGRELRSYEDMRDGMGAHQPGEEVKLRVRRGAGDSHEMVVTR